MDENLRITLRLETPNRSVERLVRLSARAYVPMMMVRPIRTDRSWLDHFGRAHLGALDFEQVGPPDHGPA
jgi:hypothetical protein